MPQGTAVRDMFAGISTRYDLANRLLSGGSDIYWRRYLARRVAARKPAAVLDLATGSGDVAFTLEQALPGNVDIQAMDFCEEMLTEARRKAVHRNSRIRFTIGDCLDLPSPDESFDVATISFGLRNLEDRYRGLREMRRVLRPGGSLFVLEFSQPHRWFRPFYFFYLNRILPTLARIATGNRAAYEYLAGSIGEFPDRPALAGEMRRAGFDEVAAVPLSLGIVALHEARREDRPQPSA